MPRDAAIQVENNFTRGLITEATGLNFPENASTDTYNCDFEATGLVRRRLGVDYESSYVSNTIASDLTDKAVTEHTWKTVAGIGNLTFQVIQVGVRLYFFEVSSTTALSANIKGFTVDIDDYAAAGAPSIEEEPAQFSSGNGTLFVFHPYAEPFFVTYDNDTDTITETQIDVKVRDFKGVDDTLETEDRPTTLSNEHKYNLYNQGWYVSAKTDTGTKNVLTYWDSERSDFPSNADIWWIYKNSDKKFDKSEIDKTFLGNTPAPKGHYILDAFYQDRSGISGVGSLSVVSSSYNRPSVGAFAFGRLFMAGVNSDNFSGNIYFSPIIEDTAQYGQCYQNADPTSENISDLVGSDGGVIIVPEIGTATKMIVVANALLVIASNGVWAITGSEGLGFSATDYVVQKLSSVGSSSPLSFVDIEGLPMWWNADGIQALTVGETQNLQVVNRTHDTIKDFLQDIPAVNIKYVKGAYNPVTRKVQWLYRSDAATEVTDHYRYDSALLHDISTGAFYPWTFSEPSSGPVIIGITATEGFGVSRASINVVDSTGNNVIDGSSNQVVITAASLEGLTASFRYVTLIPGGSNGLTFSQANDSSYYDWVTFDGGTDYSSYVITGFKVHGEGSKFFQNNYITVFSLAEGNSSLFLQAHWDYANSGDTSRWTTPQQCYPALSNYTYQRRRLKIRGKGLALQLKFFSEEGKPFNLAGWSSFETSNTSL